MFERNRIKKIEKRGIGLAVLSGVLLILSYFCYRIAWVALVPLFLACYWYKKDNFVYGLITGLIYFTFYTYWLWSWDKVATLVVIITASLFMAGFAYLSSYFKNVFTYPVFYVSLVYLLSILPIGSYWAFPGIIQGQYSMQILSVFGMNALLFMILIVNAFVANYILTKNLNNIVFAVLIILLNMLFGYLIVEDLSTDFTVALAQPNLPQPDDWRWDNSDEIFSLYTNMSISASEAKFIIFPQYTLPHGPKMFPEKISEIADFTDSYLILGTYRDLENYAPIFSPDGEIFGEYSAVNLPPFRKQTAGVNSYKVFSTEHGNFSIILCYDDTSYHVARQMTLNGAQWFFNLMNEGDFKDTIQPNLHLSRSIVRAIENRRFIVRVTDTGLSAVIDPYGKIRTLIDNDVSEIRLAGVKKMSSLTFFTRFGDLFSPIILTIGIFFVVGRFLVKKKKRISGL